MDPLEGVDFGQKISSVEIERKLKELCPDITFDVATNHGSEHPYQERLQSVYFRGRHICSMDRGIVPEITIWANFKKIVEIPWYAADREDASISYEEVLPDTPGYRDLYEEAKKESDPGYMINDKGKLLKLTAKGYENVGRRCMRLGWRHTFAKILAADLPGITREDLARTFNLDINKLGILAHDDVPVDEEPVWQRP